MGLVGQIAFVLCLLSFALPALAAPAFSVTPYVQHPATNGMSIIFFTTESCAATVKCWRADDVDATSRRVMTETTIGEWAVALTNNVSAKTDRAIHGNQYKHRVRFTDLRTLTDYCYEVALPGGGTYCNMFRTLPGRDTPVRFIGYCDCETVPDGKATDEWDYTKNGQQVRTSYYVSRSVGFASNIVHMVSRQPDLITISGDIAARGGRQENWDEFWKENAGGLGIGYNDPAGSIPILAAIGNHDLKDCINNASTLDSKQGGETALNRYLTYFEYNSNCVNYAQSSEADPKGRDRNQLFHREDLGPVTLIFLDTNEGDSSDYTRSTQGYADRPAMRAPDFHPGSLQYNWLTNQLADAQRNSRFTFVINHHCPYSVGIHNRKPGKTYEDYQTATKKDGESAQPVRVLTETMIRYGVDAWLCGHDEIQEHSQTNGFETLPDGSKRAHTLNVYDLGSGGDGLRGRVTIENPREVFRAFKDEPSVWSGDTLVSGGCHYGFIEVDVTTNRNGKWMCSLTPCYDFIYKNSSGRAAGFELRRYKDRIIIDEESDEIVYQEWKGDRTLPADYVEYVRPPQMPDERKVWTETPVYTTATKTMHVGGEVTERQYRGFLTKKGREYAWGKDGEAVTEWRQGDGTPCDLPKPSEDCELMVR